MLFRSAFSVRPGSPTASEQQINDGTLEVELVPQGILVERCRAGATLQEAADAVGISKETVFKATKAAGLGLNLPE